ncbi:hypothetical protein [uncultured Pseudacidovorax sp.]|uniref:hypothetical protein n=1 Tax=uncultured Pseudacidovorax sp. TaxID=679313 RepID=UPI0025FCB037|nr:hypothetical protein [uncultured Pseudacidovorax sp.]
MTTAPTTTWPFGHAPYAQCLIVAFTGRAGAGKDSAAKALADVHNFQTIAFADALRREISAAWRIDERMLTHRPTKELPLPALAVGMCGEPAFISWCFESGLSLHEARSPRWVLQQWASYQRRFRPDHYAAIVAAWVRRQFGTGFRHVAITDLRDPIELATLSALGAPLHVVRVHSSRAIRLADDTAHHSSERHQLPADHDIQNEGSLDALAEAVLGLPFIQAVAAPKRRSA